MSAPSPYVEYARAHGFPPPVVRYVVTYRQPDGMRTLAFPAQGRYTHDTFEAARADLEMTFGLGNPNGADRIRSIWGADPRFEVRPCECWPGHFDPCGVYFD